MWSCPECRSTRVWTPVWMDLNTNDIKEIIEDEIDWCDNCNQSILAVRSELVAKEEKNV